MNRRNLLEGALAFTCAAVMRPGQAQTVRRKRLGYLNGSAPISREISVDILIASLRENGWRIGETIEFEERWAEGDFTRLPGLANELVGLNPDIIVATGSGETKALRAATRDIPIVFIQVLDPVSLGVVA